MITPGRFFNQVLSCQHLPIQTWEIPNDSLKPQVIPNNSFISLAWPIYLLWMSQHVTAHFGWKGNDKGWTCGWSMFSLRVSEYTNTWSMVWFEQQRQSCCLTIWFTNRGECLEGIRNFAGAEVLSVIMWEIKDSLVTVKQWRKKTNKTDWGRKGGERKRQGDVKYQ